MKNSILLISLFISVSSFAQKSKGDRTLGWVVDMAENNNYDSAMRYALTGCMESVHLALNWSTIESNSGVYDFTLLDVSEIYYPAYNVEVELQLATINTVAKETPSDLKNTAFDHPTMITRFKNLLDSVFTHIPNVQLSCLNIGNEHDVFMGINANQYAAYKIFLDSVVPYAKQKYSALHGRDLKCGTTFTHHGLTATATKALCKSINEGLDIVSVTYYPIKNNFTMHDPIVVEEDFNMLVQNYSDTAQPIYFVECGYSSSTVCNSSEQKQANFYKNMFNAWDSFSNNIKFINVFKSTDWSADQIQTYKDYYGIQDTIFGEYLRTLGVRTFEGNGSSKQAYETIKCELNTRNWCDVSCKSARINKISDFQFQVYPNPAKRLVLIDSEKQLSSIKVVGPQGNVVLTPNSKTIDLDGFSSGIYYLQLESENHQFGSRKIVLE